MQGNLKQIALPEVLQFISMGKSTGLLTVQERTGTQTTLMIRQGRIINSSALERQRRLGDLLVHRGMLKRSILAQVLNVQRTVENDKRIGEILIERDLITENQIRDVLRLQLEEEIWNLFALDEGEFRFEQVDDEALGEPIVQIDIEPLLLEGSRRQDEWRRINRVLPSERMVISVKPAAEDSAAKLQLSPAEWRVLANINGRFSIRALINRTGMGRFEVCKILVQLMSRGLIAVKDEEPQNTEVLEQIQELERESSSATPLPTRGMNSFLSRLRGMPARRDEKERIDFVSPVGCISHLINQMIDQFHGLKEFRASTADSTLISQLWNDILVSYTKADLITVEKNHLNCARFEEFIRLFEFGEAVQDCFEDAVEGLLQMLDALFRIFSQRTGERTGTKIMRDLLEDIVPRANLMYGVDFNLNERIQMVLRLAA